MPDSDYSFTFDPTLNVDVGGKTVWTINGPGASGKTWSWSCDNSKIVKLEPQDGDSSQCAIYGLSGGEAVITASASDGSASLSQLISAGLMFVWGPDGKLYAATTSSFQLMTSQQEAILAQTIPTQQQMENQAAYYVPPDPAAADINVTCYVVNLEHIKQYDVWGPGSSSRQEKAKK